MLAKEPAACKVVLCVRLKPTIYIHRIPAVAFSFLSGTICSSLCAGWNDEVGTRTVMEKKGITILLKPKWRLEKGTVTSQCCWGSVFRGSVIFKMCSGIPRPRTVCVSNWFPCAMCDDLIEILWISMFREYKMTCLSFPLEAHSLHSYIKNKFYRRHDFIMWICKYKQCPLCLIMPCSELIRKT